MLKELSRSNQRFAVFAEDVADDEQSNAANSTSSTFLVLETIFEENSDDLETDDSESVSSHLSDTTDDDFESVIHITPGRNKNTKIFINFGAFFIYTFVCSLKSPICIRVTFMHFKRPASDSHWNLPTIQLRSQKKPNMCDMAHTLMKFARSLDSFCSVFYSLNNTRAVRGATVTTKHARRDNLSSFLSPFLVLAPI